MVLVVCGLGFWLVDPAPPRIIDISTVRKTVLTNVLPVICCGVSKNQIQLRFKTSQGSQENLQRISDPDSEIEVGFVRSGSTDRTDAAEKGLVSLGSLFYEPIWIFTAIKEFTTISQFRGRRINVGPDGTGVGRILNRFYR
jgi:TRAP-type uncharacterized transport system substrate-binding protein